MSNPSRNWCFFLHEAFVSFAVLSIGGCELREAESPKDQAAQAVDAKHSIDPTLQSAHYFLNVGDIKHFKQGKPIVDILKQIEWRGNFEMAGTFENESACAISFDVFSEDADGDGGEVVLAIFVEGRFAKFVEWLPRESIQVPFEGTLASYPKPIEIGDVQWLGRAVKSQPVDISMLKKEYEERPETPSHVDPGLTAAYLILRALGKTPGRETIEDYKRNAELRNQLNASRLAIGMDRSEVEVVFRAKPLLEFRTESGVVQVYGSDISLDVNVVIAYANVLVLFEDAKVTTIYAIEGGPNWRTSAEEQFSDFPR